MKTEIELIPFGKRSSKIIKGRWQYPNVSTSWSNAKSHQHHVFVTFSRDLDESFAAIFSKNANTHLLIFNEGNSTDRLMSRLVSLKIRTPQRFYVVDGCGKMSTAAFVQSFVRRLRLTQGSTEQQERILDARIDDGLLHVVSSRFNRLDIPIVQVPALKRRNSSKVQEFEIDEDGAFIYWPEFDVHLGWAQLHQLVNPEAALKASQKSSEFNKRYGRAVRTIRKRKAIKPGEIAGLSEKQLRRIENGECRLTSNAIEALAKAHSLTQNEYMKRLADILS